MEINQVKKQILDKELDKYYIFTGEERAVAKLYIDKMAEATGRTVKFADTIIDVLGKPKSKAFIQIPILYVIMDDNDFLTNEKAWDKIDSAIKDDVVVFWYMKADQRLKFWKKFKDRAVSFDKLDNRILKRHMMKVLSDKAKDRLIAVCEGSYSRILLEEDKIQAYGSKNLFNCEADEVLDKLLADGTVHVPANDAIFDFVEAVLDRDVEDAYRLLRESEECGESNMVLLSVLYTNFRNLLLYQTDKDNCGLSGFEKKNVAFAKDNYSDGELIHALRILRKCEMGIKTGRIPDEISVHYFLVNVI